MADRGVGPPSRERASAERVGLYPGTFDPVTCGHVDIILRTGALVDRLVVGVARSEEKRPLFPVAERVAMLREAVHEAGHGVEVVPFDGLLMQFAGEVGAGILFRGLRAVSDFEYEFQMMGMNRAISEDIQTVFLMAGVEYQAISSRLVKEIARFGGDVSRFVPAGVPDRLRQRLVASGRAVSR